MSALTARISKMSAQEIEAELVAIRESWRKRPKTSLQIRVAAVVRHHREADTKLSQEVFADHMGMHRAQYGFLERGIRDVRLSTLVRVAKALNKPLWTIVKEAEEAGGDGMVTRTK